MNDGALLHSFQFSPYPPVAGVNVAGVLGTFLDTALTASEISGNNLGAPLRFMSSKISIMMNFQEAVTDGTISYGDVGKFYGSWLGQQLIKSGVGLYCGNRRIILARHRQCRSSSC